MLHYIVLFKSPCKVKMEVRIGRPGIKIYVTVSPFSLIAVQLFLSDKLIHFDIFFLKDTIK